jgi:hypothetical protein
MKMGIPSMFKSPGHRTYEYKPRFWDEKKERKAELERLVEEARTGNLSDDRRSEKLRQELGRSGVRNAARGRAEVHRIAFGCNDIWSAMWVGVAFSPLGLTAACHV